MQSTVISHNKKKGVNILSSYNNPVLPHSLLTALDLSFDSCAALPPTSCSHLILQDQSSAHATPITPDDLPGTLIVKPVISAVPFKN